MLDFANVQAPIETADSLPNSCYVGEPCISMNKKPCLAIAGWRLALTKTFSSLFGNTNQFWWASNAVVPQSRWQC